ncbi:MAG: type II and III secretion system protein [Bacteroidota bacterium]
MSRVRIPILLAAAALLLAGGDVAAQTPAGGEPLNSVQRPVGPPQPRQAYVPPDQVVSFLPTTTMDQFLAYINPIFARVTGKQVVDPDGRITPIGVPVSGMFFVDAFEAVLDANNLAYRETERFFVVEEIETEEGLDPTGALSAAAGAELPATARTREIRIDAVIFELNANKARQQGTNWNVLFGSEGGGEQTGSLGNPGGATGNLGNGAVPQFSVNTSFFEALDAIIQGPDRMELGTLTRLFRLFEERGLGETVATPSVTVMSEQTGSIQSGVNIPINVQDFQGNTVTQFVNTGIIVNVTPTLISDGSDVGPDGEPVEFVHMDITVEKSTGRPQGDQIAVATNNVATQRTLIDGEMTLIGGLYSTEESISRRGIPVLMDIPILKHVFSFKNKSYIQNELLVVLQATVEQPLRARAETAAETRDLYNRERAIVRERLNRFRPGEGDAFELIEREDGKRQDPTQGTDQD